MLIFSSLIMPVQAVELTQEFKTQDGFTMYLPDGWVEIPNEVLKQHSEKVNQLAPQIGEQVYDYGFQSASADNWMNHPYILIQVKRTGRIPEEDLKHYKQIDEAFSEQMEEIGDNISKTLSNTQLGETLYDAENRVLWMNISFDLQQIGRVNAQIAVKLTGFGVIQVTGYATEDTFSTYQPLFQDIARQMNLDNSIKYKPGAAGNIPTDGVINIGNNMKVIIWGTIICGIIGLIVWLVKMKRRTS